LPLEPRWRDLLDEIARAQRLPTSREVASLGPQLARLSAFYNGLAGGLPPAKVPGARLAFSFPRDVPKSGAAVAELIRAGLLAPRAGRPLRILDLGAGLGASTWGVVRALAAAGHAGAVESTLVDTDAEALALAAAVARRAAGEGNIKLQVKTVTRSLGPNGAGLPARFDLVLLGQVLSEYETDRPEAERADSQAELLRFLLANAVDREGSLVVIEPALKTRARHLQEIRARLVASGVPIFAPCLHQDACPLLRKPTDWCHEDLPVDVPAWLIPLAREAGLRFQGITFSYLALRPDGARLASLLPAGALRAVSSAKVSKGKIEAELCGEPAGESRYLVAQRLDRDATDSNEPWGEIERGDLLRIVPTPTPGAHRIGRPALVEVLDAVAPASAAEGGS
jgi:SAM-dependent methyltransferase